jgi:hypothetical protein
MALLIVLLVALLGKTANDLDRLISVLQFGKVIVGSFILEFR